MFDDLYVESKTTMALDNAFKNRQSFNLKGPSGSGKTSITRSWLNHYKDKISGHYFISNLLSELPGETVYKDDLALTGQIFDTDTIERMTTEKNVVVIFDNYQYAKENIKKHILLLADGYVVDYRQENGLKKIDDLAFVCIIETE